MGKRAYLGVLILLLFGSTWAQVSPVQGMITDSIGNPLVGVTILEMGTRNGAISNPDGTYKVNVSSVDSAVLVFKFIGYEDLKEAVKGRSQVDVRLKSVSSESIEEVIVVGYKTTSKKEFTGAAAKLDGKTIEKLNLPRMDQALQGQIAGVSVNTNSGSPGGSSSIRIRGLSTFGDNDPLILVDGVIYDSEGLNALNPNDIASVIVLKDATAGIYGVRAANGVILIETKKGKAMSAPQFEVSSYIGRQFSAKKLNLLDATEYAVLKNEMFANGNDDLPFANTQLGEGTNWQDTVFRPATVQNFNVGVSGGTDRTNYSIAGSYFTQDGIVGLEKSNFTRLNGRVNLDVKMSDKLRLSSVLLYTNETRDALPENGIGSVLYNTINAFPTEPVKDQGGNYSYLEEVSDIINPVAQMKNTYNTTWVNKFVGKEELSYDMLKSLTWTNRFNYNVALVDNKVFSPLVWFGPGKAQNTAINEDLDPSQVEIAPGTVIDRGASVYEGRSSFSDLNFESFFNHKKDFGVLHQLRTTFGVSVFARSGQNLGATAYNIPNNSIEYADISANLAPGGYLNNATSFQYQERLLSAFLRTEYKYHDRYIVSAILRRDGSSKFGENNRYGLFPSFSGSWVISEEEFYGFAKIPFMKMRASYGISGNDQIENFAYRALLNGEGVYVFDDIIMQGVAIGRAGNPDLKWETTRQFNLGLDLRVMQSLDVATNFYIKKTRDLLFQPEVSGVLGSYGAGGSSPVINAGDVLNRGVELEIAYNHTVFKFIDIVTSLNGSWLYNEVLSTPEGLDFLPGVQFGVGGNVATRFEKGYPIGYFVGYQTDGVFQTQTEIDNSPVEQKGAKPGDLKYKDLNGDGKISFSDNSDKTMIGSPIPKFTFGYNLSLRAKGFDVSTMLFAAVGQEIIRNYERQQPFANQLSYNINRWTGPGRAPRCSGPRRGARGAEAGT